MKTNLVHTLHRMQKVGTLPVEEFKGVLSPNELIAAKNATKLINQNRPWYNIPRAKFLEYIHSVRTQCLYLFQYHSLTSCVHTNIPASISKTSQRLGMRRTRNTRTNTLKQAELLPGFVRRSWLQWRPSVSNLILRSRSISSLLIRTTGQPF